MLIFGSFYSSEKPEKMYTVLNIDDDNNNKKVSWTANQHIRMISKGCDTEDWSNDAGNLALITSQE